MYGVLNKVSICVRVFPVVFRRITSFLRSDSLGNSSGNLFLSSFLIFRSRENMFIFNGAGEVLSVFFLNWIPEFSISH